MNRLPKIKGRFSGGKEPAGWRLAPLVCYTAPRYDLWID
jgi:hypothetical protein